MMTRRIGCSRAPSGPLGTREAGAEVCEFGTLPADEELREGHFLRSGLVLDPDPSLRVVTEEQFGPTVPTIAFEDEAEAIAVANDTWAGLCSSVWIQDPERAAKSRRQTDQPVRVRQQPRTILVGSTCAIRWRV